MSAPLRIAFLTHEPFYPPSGGGSAEAVYLVEEMARRGHTVHVFGPKIPDAQEVARRFGIRLHQFEKWEMGRYAKWRNFKYLVYPFLLERMVAAAGRDAFDLKSVQSYFKNDPMVKFSKFDGADFGNKVLEWLEAPSTAWQLQAEKSSARVRAELDWSPLCRKAVDFAEGVLNAKMR